MENTPYFRGSRFRGSQFTVHGWRVMKIEWFEGIEDWQPVESPSALRLVDELKSSRSGPKGLQVERLARELTRKMCCMTKKIIFHPAKSGTHRGRDLKIIRYFFSVFPVVSVREIYSAMYHNIMAMEKSAKRLTVNCEP